MQLPTTRRTGEEKKTTRTNGGARGKKSTGNKLIHNSIFCKKKIENGWRWTLFSFAILIYELTISMFCQTKNAKPLELFTFSPKQPPFRLP